MVDDTGTGAAAVTLDAEGRQLQLEAEKARYREAIAKSAQASTEAKASTLKAAIPATDGAPTGAVTVGDKAGAFGPWLTHRAMDDAASAIAAEVGAALVGTEARVLVVEDRSLIPSDWTFREVDERLDRVERRLATLGPYVASVTADLGAALAQGGPGSTADAPGGTVPAGDLAATEIPEAVTPAAPAPAGEAVTPQAAAPETTSPAGALGAALDLVGLLRTDYALTASSVTASPSELGTLTAARLARSDVDVAIELDGFATLGESPLLGRFTAALTSRDAVAQALTALEARLAPLAAGLATHQARLTQVQQAWDDAATQTDTAVTERLRAELDRIVAATTRHEQAHAPAHAAAEAVRQALTEVDAVTNALVQAREGGHPDLLTAMTRERLQPLAAGSRRITHVLYVRSDEAGGDVLTRRSILGTSGRLGFLGSVSTSWLLLETATGTVTSGGAQAPARWMVYDLATGDATVNRVVEHGTLDADPLATLELWARVAVVGLVAVLALVGVIGILQLVT